MLINPQPPFRSSSLSSTLLQNKSKSTQLSKAMDKMARRSFHFTSRSLNRVSQFSLGKTQIKDISQRVFSAISHTKPHPSTSILNIIKGKPHRIRLGQTASATTGFNQISHDFYTNIYSDRIPNALKLTFQSIKSEEKERYRDGENSKIKLISNARKKSKLFNISQKMKKHQQESKYIKKLDSIIFGCNTLLNPEEVESRRIKLGRYH